MLGKREMYSYFGLIRYHNTATSRSDTGKAILRRKWGQRIIAEYLIARGVPVASDPAALALMVETSFEYYSQLDAADLEIGLRVAKLALSSVSIEIGIFKPGTELPAAQASFVHVYLNASTRQPCAMPAPVRAAMNRLLVSQWYRPKSAASFNLSSLPRS